MPQRTHAIVIGGSIAGMLAARILSDHFTRVTILDRDALPDSPEPRLGAPQTAHVHILLQRGLLILQQLFPSLAEALTQAGALSVKLMKSPLTMFAPTLAFKVVRRMVRRESLRGKSTEPIPTLTK